MGKKITAKLEIFEGYFDIAEQFLCLKRISHQK